MSTQRLDLPCSFSRKEGPRIALSLDKAIETTGGCSFRHNPAAPSSSSSSLVAHGASWESRRDAEGAYWERSAPGLKRFHEWTSFDDHVEERIKRKKIGSDRQQLPGGGDGGWFPNNTVERPQMEQEDRPRFLPGVAVFPPLPCSSAAVADRVEAEVGTSEGSKQNVKSDTGSSSGSRSSSPDLNENSSDYPHGREAREAVPGDGGDAAKLVHQGLELVNLLTACVESIGSRNHEATTFFLGRLGELASPGGSTVHRLAAYFTEALVLRVVKLWPHIFSIAPRRELLDRMEDDSTMALRVLNGVSPVLRFIHFTINERLLRAFQGKERIHIIDFDIKQGLQWPSLFQSLASRPNPPAQVRITGVGESKQELQETGARLAAFAEALNLPFEFHAVVDRLEDVRLWMLHVKERDSVAVNCVLQLHKLLYDDSGAALTDFLGLIRSTNPEIVLIAEQEAANNDPRWETRFASSLQYYSAVFDMVDSCLPLESPARVKVEEMLAREIRNIVSGDGGERVERHEVFGEWRKMMEERGFRCAGIGERERLLSQMLLRMFACKSYGLENQGEEEHGGGGLTLRWLDQPLYTVSAWAPCETAAAPSSRSPPG